VKKLLKSKKVQKHGNCKTSGKAHGKTRKARQLTKNTEN